MFYMYNHIYLFLLWKIYISLEICSLYFFYLFKILLYVIYFATRPFVVKKKEKKLFRILIRNWGSHSFLDNSCDYVQSDYVQGIFKCNFISICEKRSNMQTQLSWTNRNRRSTRQ